MKTLLDPVLVVILVPVFAVLAFSPALGPLTLIPLALLGFLYSRSLWIRAWFHGMPLSLQTVVGLRLRRVPARTLVDSMLEAHASGVHLDPQVLESHYLAGGRIQPMVQALIAAEKAGINVSWQRLAALDLAGVDVLRTVRGSINPEAWHTSVKVQARDGAPFPLKVQVTFRLDLSRALDHPQETFFERLHQALRDLVAGYSSAHHVAAGAAAISQQLISMQLDQGTVLEVLDITPQPEGALPE
jgi:uncharacterized protein YqfA (UPF0365 family)